VAVGSNCHSSHDRPLPTPSNHHHRVTLKNTLGQFLYIFMVSVWRKQQIIWLELELDARAREGVQGRVTIRSKPEFPRFPPSANKKDDRMHRRGCC
jgi:hypothetical protein